jgi:PAS domain S-box-containing protein
VQGILFDITLEKQEESEYRTLIRAVEQSPNVIVVTDSWARIEYVNPAFEEVTGYSSDEALGQNPRILKSGIHGQDYYQDMWQTLLNKEVWRGEICNVKKDGTLYWEDISISPVTGAGDRTTHYIAIKRDITDRKELERMREEVDRISRHDLKTPLGGIIGLPQLLIEEGNLNDRQLEYARMIEESGRKMLTLINRSVDLFKIEMGSYGYTPEKIDVLRIMRQVVADNEKIIRAKSLTVEYNLDCEGQESMYARGEEMLTYTMFGNLLTNALEASPKRGRVDVAFAEEPGSADAGAHDPDDGESDVEEADTQESNTDGRAGAGRVRISITNEGSVPEEVRDHFFEKYVTRGKRNGTGIGTYSAKMNAEVQGGSIDVETDTTHTTVVVWLEKYPRLA